MQSLRGSYFSADSGWVNQTVTNSRADIWSKVTDCCPEELPASRLCVVHWCSLDKHFTSGAWYQTAHCHESCVYLQGRARHEPVKRQWSLLLHVTCYSHGTKTPISRRFELRSEPTCCELVITSLQLLLLQQKQVTASWPEVDDCLNVWTPGRVLVTEESKS